MPNTLPPATPAPANPVIMDRLREETRAHHAAAEQGAFQQRLVRGGLDRTLYARQLVQMLAVHRALESALRDLARAHPRFALAVRPHRFQEANIEADLAALAPGADRAAVLPATRALVAVIERDARSRPAALLGHFYVLEGSKNGAKFLSRLVMKALELTPGPEGRVPGLASMDPYGELQRPRWEEFRADLNAIPLTAAEGDAMVEAAKSMFDGIRALSDELCPA
ncbi:MAG: biliverdin-producing heme oxygenase [Phycisphaerae bacterium]|nr:biliverdin-producing heme oxygenase [Phycisphaerae bacterium]